MEHGTNSLNLVNTSHQVKKYPLQEKSVPSVQLEEEGTH